MLKVKSEIVPEPELLEHACDICPRTFKTLPGLKRHKTSHDRKPQESTGNKKMFIFLNIIPIVVLMIFIFIILVLNEDLVKKEINHCNCCGEDLATAHTV